MSNWSHCGDLVAEQKMNERILALAEQTGYIGRGSNHTAYMNFDHEKFAELIVKECSNIIRNGGYRRGAFGNEDLRPSEIATMIEEHFGVEL